MALFMGWHFPLARLFPLWTHGHSTSAAAIAWRLPSMAAALE